MSFRTACLQLEDVLSGETRREILRELLKAKKFDDQLARLREGMRAHTFKTGIGQAALSETVAELDARTRLDGFDVLHDWDGKADVPNEEIIPVDVLNYLMGARTVVGEKQSKVLAMLIDYYFLYILALTSMRAWDERSPDDNLQHITDLIQVLQGPQGSGHKSLMNAETLILIATSHFEPDVRSYERLLARVRTLHSSHQMNFALAHAAILASHLRHGFEALYKRDVGNMREDNPPDYPWLFFSVATLTKAYVRMHEAGVQGLEREKAVEGLLNGLTPDTRAFLAAKPPAALIPFQTEHAELRELLRQFKDDLFKEFEDHRPSEQNYSPLAFTFNFPHNLLKGLVVNAMIEGEGSKLTINELLTGLPRTEETRNARVTFVHTLVSFARSSPDKILNKMVAVINYDPVLGIRNYNKTISLMKEYLSYEL